MRSTRRYTHDSKKIADETAAVISIYIFFARLRFTKKVIGARVLQRATYDSGMAFEARIVTLIHSQLLSAQ